MAMLIMFLTSFLCIFLLFLFLQFFHKLWWTPIRIQCMMGRQGIKGPSYRFIYGNLKEITNMRKEAISRPMEVCHNIFPRIQPELYLWKNIYGKNYLRWYGPRAQLVVTESELIKEIMNDTETFPKADSGVFVRKIFGDGLVTSEGKKWAKQRKLANHVFHGESLKGMIPAMIAGTRIMLERWKQHEGKEIEVSEEFRVFTAEVISRTAFGSSYVEGEQIFEMLLKLAKISSRNFFNLRFPGIRKIFKTSDDSESDKLEKGIRYSVLKIIKSREEKVMSGELDSYGSDFLGSLVKASHDTDENKRITIDDLVDECKTFYLAGQVTTNNLLTWTVFLLSIHTDWQEEARKEVFKLFGQQIPNSEADGIARLKTMNMIINESLRLYPPVSGFQRKAKGDIRLGKLNLPANTDLYISTLALHHDPKIWGEDVHLFKPERFSEGVAKATNHNIAAFIPFGLGPRACVGLNFASTESKIALSMILQRYSFTLSPAYKHSPYQMLSIRPKHGVQVMLHTVKADDCTV